MKLGKLRLKAFRGATEDVTIEFDTSKSITLIFGENGTGKSTIIDGLSFICEQSIGSLQDRSGAKDENFLVAAGKQKADVLIELTVANDTWKAGFNGKNIEVTPAVGLPSLRVLRRAQLSQFIESQPKERYDALKHFIETPNIEKSEQTLREAQKAADQKVAELNRGKLQTQNQLEELWKKEGEPQGDAYAWADTIAAQDTSEAEKEAENVRKLDVEVVKIRTSLSTLAKSLDDATAADSSLATAKEALAEQQAKFSSESNELLSVMQEAKKYLEKNTEAESCPVCTKGFTASEVLADLTAKIDGLSDLSKAVSAVTGNEKTVEAASERVTSALEALLSGIKAFEDLLNDADFTLSVKSNNTDELLLKINNSEIPIVQRLEAAQTLSNGHDAKLVDVRATSSGNQKNATLKNSVTVFQDELTSTESELLNASALSENLGKVLKVVETERKKFVENVFNEISQEISELYEKIHPGESIANISLNLDAKKRGSLDLAGQFHSENGVPPQAYFSESHLDTLGICIWLAFTKKFAPKNSLLILDDVLTSVDSTHLDRVINLIDEETENFLQVILTTHYRPWRDRYRFSQARNTNIHYIELKEWALDRGILVDSCMPMLSELKHFLEPANFDRQKVASTSGIFLEFLLDYLALKYGVSLPRKASQDYMLGELLSGFSAKKRQLMKIERLDENGAVIETIPLQPLLDELDGYSWIRNKVGCHFSVSGQEAADADVRKFGQSVYNFADALICKQGGDLTSKKKSGSYWESKAGRSRLHPLEMP